MKIMMKIGKSGRYWMNQGIQLKQHLKDNNNELSNACNQIWKWSSFDFSKLCWHFFMKIWKCKILMKIRKSGKYIGWIKVCNWNTSYRQQQSFRNALIKSKNWFSFWFFEKYVDIFSWKSVRMQNFGKNPEIRNSIGWINCVCNRKRKL